MMTDRPPAADSGPDTADEILSDDVLAGIRAPIERARSLPSAAYTSADFLHLENERLFAPTWMLAGFGAQMPAPGDGMPVTVAGRPLFLVRNAEGRINAFHNVCPHRGSRLLPEACSGKKLLTCPYHAWTFDLDGNLRLRPHFHGADAHDVVKPDEAGERPRLWSVRCAQWQDLVFVNLSGAAPPLEDHLRPMTDRLAGHDLSTLRYAGSIAFEVAANWKLVHENYIETYHVFAVHPRLSRFAPMNTRGPTLFDGLCIHNEYRFPAPEEGRGEGLPYYPGLSEDDRRRGLWFHLFPTLDLELWPDQFAVLHATPLSPERTREEIHVYLVGEAAQSDAYAEARRKVFDMWRDLNDEDVKVLELLQQGRHSPAYDGGSFSPYWEPATQHFVRLVADAVAAGDRRAG